MSVLEGKRIKREIPSFSELDGADRGLRVQLIEKKVDDRQETTVCLILVLT